MCVCVCVYIYIYIYIYIECPTRYRTRHFFNNSNTNEDIATKQTHTIDTFLFISHTTNVLLFKFRCNIFIGVRIIKEMPVSVASGAPCIFTLCILYNIVYKVSRFQNQCSCEHFSFCFRNRPDDGCCCNPKI